MKNSIYAIKEWEYKNPFEVVYTMEIWDVQGQIPIEFHIFNQIRLNAINDSYYNKKKEETSSPSINPLNRPCERVLTYVIN
jgi:hypothetical protein